MTLGIARPVMSPPSLPALRPPIDPRNGGEDPARIRATIARAPLFAALPITAIEDLTSRVTVRKVSVGSAVVAQDEPGDAMFVIMSGRVKVVMFGESGREVTLSLLRAGDSFGEMSLFDQGPRSAHCLAIEPTTLLALCDVNERLIHRLVGLAREEGASGPDGLVVRRRPTQQELANMIGSCRETISRAFNQLARDGLIIPRGRSLVVTPALIERAEKKKAA